MFSTTIPSRLALTTLVIAALFVPTAVAEHGHGDDFIIGVDGTTNQIRLEYDPDNFPFSLPSSEEPLLIGAALDDPGLIGLHDAEPEENFYPLDPGSEIAFELLSADPAMKVWDPLGPGEAGFQILPNEPFSLGSPEIHAHLWWHIDAADPQFDENDAPWDLTFRIVDLTDTHVASDPVSVSFVPEPTSLFGLLMAAAALPRRRTIG